MDINKSSTMCYAIAGIFHNIIAYSSIYQSKPYALTTNSL